MGTVPELRYPRDLCKSVSVATFNSTVVTRSRSPWHGMKGVNTLVLGPAAPPPGPPQCWHTSPAGHTAKNPSRCPEGRGEGALPHLHLTAHTQFLSPEKLAEVTGQACPWNWNLDLASSATPACGGLSSQALCFQRSPPQSPWSLPMQERGWSCRSRTVCVLPAPVPVFCPPAPTSRPQGRGK